MKSLGTSTRAISTFTASSRVLCEEELFKDLLHFTNTIVSLKKVLLDYFYSHTGTERPGQYEYFKVNLQIC